MIGTHTKRLVDAAIDELKRDHYKVIMLLQDERDDDNGIEILSSFTTDKDVLREMAKDVLGFLADEPRDQPGLEN
jgi:hypothetical protein